MSSFVPSFSSVAWAAFRAGSCGFVSWRVSSRAASGRVAVASFDQQQRAVAFARGQAALIGRSVVVRAGPVIGGQVTSWRISVLVLIWLGSEVRPSGQLFIQGDGLRGLASSLRTLGFVSAVA